VGKVPAQLRMLVFTTTSPRLMLHRIGPTFCEWVRDLKKVGWNEVWGNGGNAGQKDDGRTNRIINRERHSKRSIIKQRHVLIPNKEVFPCNSMSLDAGAPQTRPSYSLTKDDIPIHDERNINILISSRSTPAC
jgi:hypothetical protein